MLEVKQLKLTRASGFTVNIDTWAAKSGKLQAVLGANGAGKSTFMRLLCAEEPAAGKILLHDQPLEQWQPLERARHLAVLPQASTLDFGFTAHEVVSLGLTPLAIGWREAHRIIDTTMQATDCFHLAKQSYPNLSGGERQRVHLARVLVQLSQAEREPVLLLDEPTAAQDVGQQHRLLQLAKNLARDKHYIVVAIIHDLNLALRYADSASLLDAGKLITSGCTSSVITAGNIEQYWGYRARLHDTEHGYSYVV